MPAKELDYSVATTVKRFEGRFAVLEMADQQTIRWPIKNLPDDVQEGVSVRLSLMTAKIDDEARAQLARAVINSLLS